MHFFKTLSLLTATTATLTVAAPVPGLSNAEVNTSGFVEEVAMPTTTAAALTAAAAPAAATTAASSQQQQQQPSQHAQDKDVLKLVPAGASSAGAAVTSEAPAVVYTTVTAGAPASAQTSAAQSAAASAPSATTITVASTPEAASQPSQTVAPTVAASSATSAPSPSATTSSSSSGSSSGSSSSSGSGLTIINKCSRDVQGSEAQGLNAQGVGSQTIPANGGTAHFAINGNSQTVKVSWAGTDIFATSNNANSEVEWTLNGSNPFFDLSLLTGNPFLQYGQKLESPCQTVSCAPGVASCTNAYYPGGPDATLNCPALAQGQGLTYTLCES